MEIDEIQRVKDASDIRESSDIVAYNHFMRFRTKELLSVAETLPSDERSINNAEREFPDTAAALTYFGDLKRRFLDIKQWNHNSHISSYELFNADGIEAVNGQIRPGLFIKITLHGSGKSDWVRVEGLTASLNELVITVKPTYDPTAELPQMDEISHFFSAEARNNFCVLCDQQFVRVYVIGVNEKLNSDRTSGILETLRNTAVANLGSYLGIQNAVWRAFCESFLADNDP